MRRARRGEPEVTVGDRVAVRVEGGEPEPLVDACLELLRQRVLEPVGLVVHRVERKPERVGQVPLDQPVVAQQLDATRRPSSVSESPR